MIRIAKKWGKLRWSQDQKLCFEDTVYIELMKIFKSNECINLIIDKVKCFANSDNSALRPNELILIQYKK